MFKKAYLEITNICNLKCTFCHGTKRAHKLMTTEEFRAAAEKLVPHTKYLYFHLMGEPLLHPNLAELFDIAHELGFKVVITTNGTLLKKKKDVLFSARSLHKISISLHSFEANDNDVSPDEYLKDCFEFAAEASDRGIISVMRLWNLGGLETLNTDILSLMREYYPNEWTKAQNGFRLKDKCFLEWGEKFDWPDKDADVISSTHTCYGLRDQIGILCDGTVVPCCLDADGVINLGNIFEESIDEILEKPRAVALKKSFENRNIKEPLCQKCGFATKRLK